MDTMEITKSEQLGGTFTRVVAVIAERISRLAEADKNDLFELAKAFRTAQSAEDMDSISAAIQEILDQEPVAAEPLNPLDFRKRPDRLQKWVDHVGGKIRELRKARDLTQEQLAELSGLPQSHVSRLESGRHAPSHATLEKIAAALKVEVGCIDPHR